MNILKLLKSIILLIFISTALHAQTSFNEIEKFDSVTSQITTAGRGMVKSENGTLITKDAYACFGEKNWKNYKVSFNARTPPDEEQVQIWAGFRAYNRNDRYLFGFRGGLQNNLYLSRMGYMATDEFLALRKLDFHPEPGTWYNFRIEVCGPRIRVFLNDEPKPRIDVIDRNSDLAPSGPVTLGGSWITTEFKNLSIESLSNDYLNNVDTVEYSIVTTKDEKEKQREVERKDYKPVKVDNLQGSRTEVSLDGKWLFMPEYELPDEAKAVSLSENDNNWHTMKVPSFWNPIRIWLHGETFGPFPKGIADTYYQQETDRCEGYTFDYKKTSSAWYRQWMDLPYNIEGKELELVFDAVSRIAEVWINGSLAGKHIGMFGDFRINGTNLFKPGKNLIVVKVIRDYTQNISDANKVVGIAVSVEVTNKMLKDLAHGFYDDDPAGIWQPVSLVITDPVKIEDVYIKPNLEGAVFEATVKNNSGQKKSFDLSTNILDKQTSEALYKGVSLTKCKLNAGEEKMFTFSVKNLKPKLWSPRTPNLYDFTFSLVNKKKEIDRTTICSGFRTFKAKEGYFWLNGRKYWLRGANQTPFALAPNSAELADTFFNFMKAGNIEVTRTHTSPYNELWMDAADRDGIGISFEGTWPWLMLGSSMPDMKLINLWADEFIDLLKKYRNHPSLLFWTVNNEMKFYELDPDFERTKLKMKIISDVVKRMRKADSTRPICFDSNYRRNIKKFGKDFFNDIDDGDMDDVHAYTNWYDNSIFQFFNGEFQKHNLNEGRPLISQEMSTGYPDNETGHATRFYNLVHQNPQSLIGNYSYENCDPAYFLNVNSFLTGELAEALRRSNDSCSGFLHFALISWFRNVYNPQTIEPYPTYYALKRAMQPVLVSAEIWGRNFYAGQKLPVRICIVNDNDDGADLKALTLSWELVTDNGTKLTAGNEAVPEVKYYSRKWITPGIMIPASLPESKTGFNLILKLTQNGKTISGNQYRLLAAAGEWSRPSTVIKKKIVLVDFENMKAVFDSLQITTTSNSSVSDALKTHADLYVFAGLDQTKNCTAQEIKQIREFVAKGGKVFLIDSEGAVKEMYPEYIKGWIVPTEGDIANMEIPESPLFDGIAPMELRYFNNNKREIPTVCHVALTTSRNPNVEELASHIKIHGYINGNMENRSKYMQTIKGFPIVKIKDNGSLLISTMSLEKAATDPIAGRLLSNIIINMLGY
jgi:hypothetical protein